MLTGQPLDEHVRTVASQLAADLAATIQTHGADAAALKAPIATNLQSCLDALAQSNCWGSMNQVPSSLLWNPNRDVLERGGLQWHARSKPLGYAGDFQLLDRICRNETTDDPIGQAMDVFFQAQTAPQAVRNRYQMIASIIAEQAAGYSDGASSHEPFRVASVGSGPGWDIDWALATAEAEGRREVKDRLHLSLIDIDPRSLDFCKTRLAPQLASDQLHTIQANLGRLPRLSKVLDQIENSRLIYCAGYFDYLNDEDAITMLRALWKRVAPGGELLVFNFNEQNPSRAYMEWFGNWYLIYRTADSLKELSHQAQLEGADIEVGIEPAGVNLFLRCRK